ncbi:M2 family metallopeptidase [Singulisphaera sp. Ch08]|uniref:M2 family metallopeptidase n=1 Tax=Singulisphaera sp. Ch08 TaxID=3120278 RepID=A0AAU7CF53_9BACT
MFHRSVFLTMAVLLMGLSDIPLASGAPEVNDNDVKAQRFVSDHVTRIRPLERSAALSWWNANVTGKDEDFAAKEEAQNRLDAALADRQRFSELKAIKESPVSDPALKRQIEVLYLSYLEKQVDPQLLRKISAKANAIEKAFNAYRATVDRREMTDSEVRKVLKESNDQPRRQAVWEASKGVGPAVEADLKALVALRNEAAHTLGFKNYHAMQLHLNEQSQEQVLTLFDELDALTRAPFRAAKAEIDGKLAANFGLKVDELRPWHYHDPFFQETPAVFKTDLDEAYAKADILELCRKFYAGIGLPIEDVINQSDLYEKPGKSPHAFCIDIDREGDVRVLANIVPNEYWMGTMLHELGHSVYSSKNIPRDVPYVLRTEAHILATEGVAMMFEKFSKDADWLQQMGVKLNDPRAFDEAGAKMRSHKLLIFSRWCQVMLRFEKSLYENPEQDLNTLWWDLVEKYQELRRPNGRNAPDYASKIHIVSAPAYYHNYMMGELFAAQVHHTIAREVLQGVDPSKASYVGNQAVGRFLKERLFGPGRSLTWDDLTRHVTGQSLNPKSFALDFQSH